MYDTPSYKERKSGDHAPGDPAHLQIANEATPAEQPAPADKPPCISVYWSESAQEVSLGFDTDKFRKWDFVIACLDMAKARAVQQKKMAEMAAMQQQMMQQAQSQQLAGKLLRGRH